MATKNNIIAANPLTSMLETSLAEDRNFGFMLILETEFLEPSLLLLHLME
jgi:hypothetical protein